MTRGDMRSINATLDRDIRRIELQMAHIIAADNQLAAIDRRMQTVPGVGPIVSATLIAELPELGRSIGGALPRWLAWRQLPGTAEREQHNIPSAEAGPL